MNNIPIYEAIITDEDDLGVDYISLVKNPAMESLFIAFAKEDKIKLQFNKDKQIIIGAALIPDKKVYRVAEDGSEYYIQFSRETIEKVVSKYFKTSKQINFNLEHQDNMCIQGNVVESWITGKNDKSKDLGFDVPVGTWMLSIYIPDQKLWNLIIKKGYVKGFSIEGQFGYNQINLSKGSRNYVLVEYNDLLNSEKLQDYVNSRYYINRIVVLSDINTVTASRILKQKGIFIDEIIDCSSFGSNLQARMSCRVNKISEIQQRYTILEVISSNNLYNKIYRELGLKIKSPTHLSLKPQDAKEIVRSIVKKVKK